MSAFEDFVNLELPKRPVMLTLANSGYDNDPNSGGAPAVVANSPQGTYFFRTTGNILYVKNTSAPGSWAVVGSGSALGPTTTPLTWHVETTGNDTTGDGSVGLPFLTPAGALTRLKTSFTAVSHQVDIVLGVGNFPGFLLSGVNILQPAGSTPVGIRILGTYVAPTLTTGVPSGTITSRVSGTTTGTVAFTSITDSAATWTVDELRGMLLELVTGTGSPTKLPILSNTADTITFLSVSTTAGSVGGTFNIVEWGSNLNTTVQIPPAVPFAGAVTGNPTNAVIAIFNSTPANNIQVNIEGIRIGPTTAVAGAQGIFSSGTPVQIRRCFVGGTGTTPGARISINGFSSIGSVVTQSVIASPGLANTTMVSGTNLTGLTYSTILSGLSTLATGYLPLRIAGQGVALGAHASFSNVNTLGISTIVLHPLSFGIFISNCLSATLAVASWDWQSNLSQPLSISGNTTCAGTSILALGPAQSGINLSGPARFNCTGLYGSTPGLLAQYGVLMGVGAKLKIDPTTTITGSSGDVRFITNPIPFAFLRSLTEKSIVDQFETALTEI